MYLRLELCKCDLLRYANNQPNTRLAESDTTDFTRQLLVGLRDLHLLGILHRDIKPENLLITNDGILKIADFGWCADLKDGPSTLAGTFQYMAPEILGSLGVQTEAVDVWSSGVTIIQLATGRPLLTTFLGPGATGISNTDPHNATKMKTNQLLEEIHQRCPLADELRPADISWKCWDCLMGMLIPEVSQRKTIEESLNHCWLTADQVAPGQDWNGQEEEATLMVQLDECPSSASLGVPLSAVQQQAAPQAAKLQAVETHHSSASSDSAGTPRMEVPTPPCARSPGASKMSVSAPRMLPASAVPSLPQGSTPSRTAQVKKLVVSGGLASASQSGSLPTPKATPKATPQSTPVRNPEFVRCRRSETAPSPLPIQADAASGLVSSRKPATEPPSPIATSRTPMSRTPVTNRVTRAQTSFGEVRSPIMDQTIYTMENIPAWTDELSFRNPALLECENRMASMVRQLESKGRSSNREHEGRTRGSSVGIPYESRRIKDTATVPDLRTFTEIVRSCGQTMRRASTAVGEEVNCRRASYDQQGAHQMARSVTLKPRGRRREASPLRATVGAGLSSPSVNCSVVAPACSVNVPAGMSVSAPSGIYTDVLSRTAPSDFIQMSLAGLPHSRLDGENDVVDEKMDKLSRTAVAYARPMSMSISTSAPLKQSTTTSGGYPQRLTTSTPSHTVDRLSPRPFVTTTSSRSPLVPLRASPPQTPSAETYRDVMLARSNTISNGTFVMAK